MRKVTLVSIVAALALLVGSRSCLAHDQTTQNEAMKLDGLSVWRHTRFSESELEGLQPGDLGVEAHFCSCYDKPNKHFPYSIVLLKTSRGDLVTRPERLEGAVTFTALAVRYADLYCDMDSEEHCHGSFSEPCEFTDFRYGPYLAAFFPTCKSDEDEPVLTHPENEGYSRHPFARY